MMSKGMTLGDDSPLKLPLVTVTVVSKPRSKIEEEKMLYEGRIQNALLPQIKAEEDLEQQRHDGIECVDKYGKHHKNPVMTDDI